MSRADDLLKAAESAFDEERYEDVVAFSDRVLVAHSPADESPQVARALGLKCRALAWLDRVGEAEPLVGRLLRFGGQDGTAPGLEAALDEVYWYAHDLVVELDRAYASRDVLIELLHRIEEHPDLQEPGLVSVLFLVAGGMAETGNEQASLLAYQAIVDQATAQHGGESDAQVAAALRGRGRVLAEMRQFDAAFDEFDRALAAIPPSAAEDWRLVLCEIRNERASWHEYLGRPEEARADREAVLAILTPPITDEEQPQLELARKALNRLQADVRP